MDNREEYERLRAEWERDGLLRTMAERTLGKVCYNCGSTEGIEMHHVVPLKLGGTNNLSNIVVLCHRCHCAAHYGRHIRDYQNKDIKGRPHKVSDDVLDAAFDDYTKGRIGTRECKEIIHMAKSCKIADMSYYKRYLKDQGIKSVKNNIDIIMNKRGHIRPGDIVGAVEYKDGRIEVLTCQREYA